MIREGTALSELPDYVQTLRLLLIQKDLIISDKEATISGKDTFIAELEKRNEILAEQVTLLRKYRFARSSERWTDEDRKQQGLFDEAELVVSEPRDEEESETEQISYTRKKGKKGRKPLPDYLPRTVIMHELSEDERRCKNESCSRYGSCEKCRPVIGEETRVGGNHIPH